MNGRLAHFLCAVVDIMVKDNSVLEQLLIGPIAAVDCTLWGVEYHSAGELSVLRVYIDKPNGVTIDDCARASQQIHALLTVEGEGEGEELISGSYRLEVSSPGLDRILFHKAHYAAYIGQKIELIFKKPIEKHRKLRAILRAVQDENIVVESAQGPLTITFNDVKRARLVFEG